MKRSILPAHLDKLTGSIYGHYWTVVPHLKGMVRRWSAGHRERIDIAFNDPVSGPLSAGGFLHRPPAAETLFILVHGLGGRPESAYVREAAQRFWSLGHGVLRMGLRGAEGHQPDFYHAGLTTDLEMVLSTPPVRQFKRCFIVGFSLGGHVALTLAANEKIEGVSGVVSVCAPLDLRACQVWLDRSPINFYRKHCLDGLKRTLRAVRTMADQKGLTIPVDWSRLNAIKTIYDWDDAMVVPRFGFGSVEAYYDRISVGPKLDDLYVPALIISARHDPR